MGLREYIGRYVAPPPTCVICLTEERSRLFHPCMHLCACDACAARVTQCPLCKTPVCARWKVYMS